MPNRKKSKSLKKVTQSDVTIYHSADSVKPVNRIGKHVTSEENQKISLAEITNTPNWDEIDDFELRDADSPDETQSVIDVKVKSKPAKAVADIPSGHKYLNIPVDIWYLIAEKIPPEDVQTFACINKATHAITHTYGFWFNLYKRHFRLCSNLPSGLMPYTMKHKWAIRTKVIKALFIMYEKLQHRLASTKQSIYGFNEAPVKKKVCEAMWKDEKGNHYIYNFKLIPNFDFYNKNKNEDPIFYNRAERVKILEVRSTISTHIPYVSGMTLVYVTHKISSGCLGNKVTIAFTSGVSYQNSKCWGQESDSVVINLDPVASVRILDWWHPDFPLDCNHQT